MLMTKHINPLCTVVAILNHLDCCHTGRGSGAAQGRGRPGGMAAAAASLPGGAAHHRLGPLPTQAHPRLGTHPSD